MTSSLQKGHRYHAERTTSEFYWTYLGHFWYSFMNGRGKVSNLDEMRFVPKGYSYIREKSFTVWKLMAFLVWSLHVLVINCIRHYSHKNCLPYTSYLGLDTITWCNVNNFCVLSSSPTRHLVGSWLVSSVVSFCELLQIQKGASDTFLAGDDDDGRWLDLQSPRPVSK